MKTEIINYKGWKDCIRLSNESIEMIITTQVGPRIIRFGYIGEDNLFYENPGQIGSTGGNEWKVYGGHRFWIAPEVKVTTYIADNSPIQFELGKYYAQLTASIEPTGLQKRMEISIDDQPNRVTIKHEIINQGLSTLSLAPWAISAMRPGGIAVIPHNLGLPDQLQPTHSIALWSYSRLSDPRLICGDHFIFLKQDPLISSAIKIGGNIRYGWAGYVVNNTLFIKYFAWDPTQPFPDFNCNFESYTNADMLEMESLGILSRLEPGESVSHYEKWEVFSNIPIPTSEEDVQRFILPSIKNGE